MGQAQSVPTGFNPGANAEVTALAVQPDGSIVVGGAFTTLGGGGTGTTTRNRIGRLAFNGLLDQSFNPGANGAVSAIVLQPDGKILVAGHFTTLGGGGTGTNTRQFLGRLNADGSLDAAFNPGANAFVAALTLQPDGRILIGGAFTMAGGGFGTTPRSYVARLNADGSIDPSFNPGADGHVLAIALQANGEILLGGAFSALGGGSGTSVRHRLGRLHTDGAVDASFNPGANSTVLAIVAQPDGGIVAGGAFTMLGGGGTGTTPRTFVGRVAHNGSLDSGFFPGADATVRALAVQQDGRIVVGGAFTMLGGGGAGTTPRNRIGRVHPDGSLDTGFDPGANDIVAAVALQGDERVVIGGHFWVFGGGGTGTTSRNRLARVHADATLDATFAGGISGMGNTGLAVLPDGRILASAQSGPIGGEPEELGGPTGTTQGFGGSVARLRLDGSQDAGFRFPIITQSLVAQPDGKSVFVGDFTDIAGTPRQRIVRMEANGTVDAAFDPGANNNVNMAQLQPDGKILVTGLFTMLGGGTGTTPRSHIGRLNPDGTIDAAFDPGASQNLGGSVAIQPDGKILAAGAFQSPSGNFSGLGRLHPDGSLDDPFGAGAGGPIYAIAVQADGKILVGGAFSTLGGTGTGSTPRLNIGRLNADGSLDEAFNPGANADVRSFAVQRDGKILIAGVFTAVGGGTGTATPRHRIARLNADGSVDASFVPELPSAEGAGSLALEHDGSLLVGVIWLGISFPPDASNRFYRLGNSAPAGQRLRVSDAGQTVTWSRTGVGPEFWRTAFEWSPDGLAYLPLGSGTRIAEGWQVTGLELPVNQDLYVRARGYYTSGYFNGSGSITQSLARVYVACPTVAPASIPAGAAGLDYSAAFTAAGAIGHLAFNTTSVLPAGVTLSSAGVLAGVPSQAGSFPLTITATDDSSGCTGSQSVTLTIGATAPAQTELVRNGSFANGAGNWQFFATPDQSYIVSSVVNGVLEFYRVPPPPGMANQAVAFQQTGVAFTAAAPIVARVDLGNSSTVRKRVGIVVHDADFSDLAFCSFWLGPNTPLASYSIYTHTTEAWTNATISFYAASAGSDGGAYRLDNVSLQYRTGRIGRRDPLCRSHSARAAGRAEWAGPHGQWRFRHGHAAAMGHVRHPDVAGRRRRLRVHQAVSHSTGRRRAADNECGDDERPDRDRDVRPG